MQAKNFSQIIFKIFSCVLLISGLNTPTNTYATDYFVAPNGNDSHPGTKSAPVRTITKGISLMRDGSEDNKGDRLYIRAGNYSQTINSNYVAIPTGTSWDNAPVIAAYPGETVVLRPGSGSIIINIADPDIQYIIFERLILDGTNLARTNGTGISVGNGANHVRFLDMEVKDCPSLSVQTSLRPSEKKTGISQGGVFNEFIGGKYHGAGKNRGDAISPTTGNLLRSYNFYITTDHNLFEGLEVYDATHYGFHIYNAADPRPSHNIVRNSRIYNNSIESASTAGILLASGKGNMAYNNLVYNNRGHGIQVGNGSIGAKVYNNTIYRNWNGIQVGVGTGSATKTIIKNNISYKNRKNYENIGKDTLISSNLMDGTDPLFVNASNGDFHTQGTNPKSPAIDAGEPLLTEVRTDFDGNARGQGNPYDIGAFEFNPLAVGAPVNLRTLTSR